jgi:uncharacterized protein YecT (DUF1311 family)
LKNCNADSFYYGLKQPIDAEKARLCAYSTNDYDVLTMIYANGRGAKRNLDLAIKFACDGNGAPAEITGRVQHLIKLKNAGWQGNDFDICDDITSGYMMGYCASIDAIFSNEKREKQIDDMIASWSDSDKEKFKQLRDAKNKFVNDRIDNEQDLSGTARTAMQIAEEKKLNDDFLASLKQFQQGLYPKFSSQQFATTDAKLNTLYSKIQSNINFSYGTVTKAGIKKTQKTWLSYRDAWVKFAKSKYPDMPTDGLKTWLTQKRIEMLQEFE